MDILLKIRLKPDTTGYGFVRCNSWRAAAAWSVPG
jgi:hypothetical protein